MRIKPVSGQVYHIYNRGVEKRNVFMNDRDRFMFIHDLFEFNDEAPALNSYYKSQPYEVRLRKVEIEKKKRGHRKSLVEILAFCMMTNHFHLLIRQKVDNGITEFMRKLGTGYTNYFNRAYKRVGPLFQGKYKAVLIKDESHLLHLPYYIHSNPIEIIEPNWKENDFNVKKIMKYLEFYRWSSYQDYIGKNNFPSIINKNFLNNYFTNNIKTEMYIWLKNMKTELESMKTVVLD